MDQSNTQPQSYEAQVRELALRLTNYPGYRPARDPQLLVGQLPSTFPTEIPLPEGSRVVGSLVQSEEFLEIVLDTPLSAVQVFAFYRERMLAAGWHTYDSLMGLHEISTATQRLCTNTSFGARHAGYLLPGHWRFLLHR